MTNLSAFTDALHGDCTLDPAVESLARCPIVQRLREIRLSNIDSLCMPGVANTSRYEHSLGVALLVSKLGFQTHLTATERQTMQAAALLHDTAIPPFGHLVEEAMQYCSLPFHHEDRWQQIFASETLQVGGIDCQLYHGRQAGVRRWADRVFRGKGADYLESIFQMIQGKGPFGGLICGSLDLDNLDNVVRAAFHIGLEVDKKLPEKIARSIIGVESGLVVLERANLDLIQDWLHLREKLYTRFMLSRVDFIGKTMLLYATVKAFANNLLTEDDWTLTDRDFLTRLLEAPLREVAEPVESWMCSELWPIADLIWLDGEVPLFSELLAFSDELNVKLGRRCFAYRIKDKRTRKISVKTSDGEIVVLGKDSGQWLLGICGIHAKEFTRGENREISSLATETFHSRTFTASTSVSESEEDVLFKLS